MLAFLKKLVTRFIDRTSTPKSATSFADEVSKRAEQYEPPTFVDRHNEVQELVPYDETLLEKARIQWQFGDWNSLVKIARDHLQHHPDRAKLALLVCAGHGQLGNLGMQRQFARLAIDWGCSKRLVSQILISGVHNSLGCSYSALGRFDKARLYFNESIQTGMPEGNVPLIVDARAQHQTDLLEQRPRIQSNPDQIVEA